MTAAQTASLAAGSVRLRCLRFYRRVYRVMVKGPRWSDSWLKYADFHMKENAALLEYFLRWGVDRNAIKVESILREGRRHSRAMDRLIKISRKQRGCTE